MKDTLRSILPKPIFKYLKKSYNRLQELQFSGDAVTCNICHTQYSKFAPYGFPKRENAKCLHCGSLERHRLMYEFFTNRTNLFSPDKQTKIKVLHFAPEEFFYQKLSEDENVDYIPCDLFPDIFEFDSKGLIQKVDITEIPYEEDTFDYILCNHVLEHIIEDHKAMKELFRVMKTGGMGIFQVPMKADMEKTYEDFSITSKKERKIAFGQEDHVRWYGKDYKTRLEKAGFTVTISPFVESFSKEEHFRFGFMSNEYIYACTKK